MGPSGQVSQSAKWLWRAASCTRRLRAAGRWSYTMRHTSQKTIAAAGPPAGTSDPVAAIVFTCSIAP